MSELALDRSGSLGESAPRASWNPLAVSGTAMPDNLLLATKLMALAFVLSGQVKQLPYHYLPFISVLGHLGSGESFHRGLQLIFLAAAAVLMVNRQVRTMCLVLAAVLLVGVLSSRIYYHNNRLYTGLFFLLAGLYDPRVGVSLFRYQLAVLYFGAALNKIALVDWRDGAFVQAWLPHYWSGYLHVARVLPDQLFSATFGWIAIVTEFSLVVLLLIPRLVPIAIFVGLGYHTGLVLLTGSTFGVFWYALFCTYLTLMAWPRSQVRVTYRSDKTLQRWTAQALERVDVERRFDWRASRSGPLEAQVDGTEYRGSAAAARLLLYSPPVYLAYFVVITLAPEARVLIPVVIFPMLAAIAWGALKPKLAAARAT
jgi:hypothetical protein